MRKNGETTSDGDREAAARGERVAFGRRERRFERTSVRVAAPGVCLVVFALAFVVGLGVVAGSGCATLGGSSTRRLNDADRLLAVDSPLGPRRTQTTLQTLRAYRVSEDGKVGLPELAELRRKIDENPTAETIAAYVETAYCEARRLERSKPDDAERLYASAALYAYHSLFNPGLADRSGASMFGPRTLDVATLYNGSCERLLRLRLERSKRFPFRPGKAVVLPSGANDSACAFVGDASIYCRAENGSWTAEELESFQVATDCDAAKLDFDSRRSGLGVPLVAKRRADSERERPEEAYYPTGLYFPATAILRPNPNVPLGSIPALNGSANSASDDATDERAESDEDFGGATAILDLFDPLVSTDALLEGITVPLECDLTTPLAYFFSTSTQLAFETGKRGLFNPETFLDSVASYSSTKERSLQGLYMIQPYDPNKIPVVLIHGLASSPLTWTNMCNALLNAPDIRNNYQFWFYFYPTGQPFWISAAQFRRDLESLRAELDPNRDAPALDRTVLIGHSMGGLIARMQVASSGDRIWRRIATVPPEALDVDDETKAKYRDWFFFEPNPSVRGAITIATPFEGSEFANGFTEWVAGRLISAPKKIADATTALVDSQFADVDDPTLLLTKTSVESLSPKSPIFEALDECPIPERVALNNVVGVVPSLEKRLVGAKRSDGIVDFKSSHREDVESEREVPSAHMYVHTHPAALLETKEILLRRLAEFKPEIAAANRAKAARAAATRTAEPEERWRSVYSR